RDGKNCKRGHIPRSTPSAGKISVLSVRLLPILTKLHLILFGTFFSLFPLFLTIPFAIGTSLLVWTPRSVCEDPSEHPYHMRDLPFYYSSFIQYFPFFLDLPSAFP